MSSLGGSQSGVARLRVLGSDSLVPPGSGARAASDPDLVAPSESGSDAPLSDAPLSDAPLDVVVKWGLSAERAATEAAGLRILADAEAVRVPGVLAVGEDPPFLASEWLDADRGRTDFRRLGRELARLHTTTADTFGLDHDNFIGRTPQINRRHDDWVAFFRESRLRPQLRWAVDGGRLPGADAARAESVLRRLDTRLPRSPDASLIHGDLWSGNVLGTTDGPAVIDPAVSYSHREAEIAFTRLFGGFAADFYAAYEEAWPQDPGWQERTDLYNLYHLLNHLNLFGGSYLAQVQAVTRRYA